MNKCNTTGSTIGFTIINSGGGLLKRTARGSTLVVRRSRLLKSIPRPQISTSKFDPRTVRVKIFLMTVDPESESESDN